jgi:pre-mRNA-splicing factor ATP-dependent RNA helicase DHX16
MRAMEQLYALGALNDKGALTVLGRRMAEFPCDPQVSKMIVASERWGCSEEAVTVAAMLDAGNAVFYRPKDKALLADAARAAFARGLAGDHATLVAVFHAWRDSGFSVQWCFENFIQAKSMKRARDVREQLVALCERVEVPMVSAGVEDGDALGQAVVAGFFYNVARLDRSGAYRTVKKGQGVHIHPSSCLAKAEVPAPWLVFHELVDTGKEYMRQCMAIKREWLGAIAPHYYHKKDLAEEGGKRKGGGGSEALAKDIADGQNVEEG